jgi:hypothetical protein
VNWVQAKRKLGYVRRTGYRHRDGWVRLGELSTGKEKVGLRCELGTDTLRLDELGTGKQKCGHTT